MRSSWLKRRRGSLRRQEGATMEKKGGNLRPCPEGGNRKHSPRLKGRRAAF